MKNSRKNNISEKKLSSKKRVRTEENKDFQRISFFVPLFIISTLTPIIVTVGSIHLTPYRLLLLLLFFPCFFSWVSGGIGKIRTPDVLIFCLCVWGALSIVIAHGVSYSIESVSIFVLQTFGPYLLARKYIRNEYHFKSMVRFIFISVLVLTPFAVYESLTGHNIALSLIGKYFTVLPEMIMGGRLGLDRAQVVLEHPIFFGVYCASVFSLAFHVLGYSQSFFGRLVRAMMVVPGTFLSLSTGALLPALIQIFLVFWDRVLNNVVNRWKILGQIIVLAYVSVDLISNRSPAEVFISYLTFNIGSSFNRILIWKYGTAEVANNPIFGIGFNEWTRPVWMHASFDNFWLLTAMRHGVPALIFLAGSILLICLSLGKINKVNGYIKECRKGYLMTMAALFVAGCTVHYWNSLYCYFMFFLGSGVWMIEAEEKAVAAAQEASDETPDDEFDKGPKKRGRLIKPSRKKPTTTRERPRRQRV